MVDHPGEEGMSNSGKATVETCSNKKVKRQLRVLLLSKDQQKITWLKSRHGSNDCQSTRVEIVTVDSLTKAILLAEESKFDVIVVDYSIIPKNILTIIEYLTCVNRRTKNIPKIILTEHFTHIKESKKNVLLQYVNKVLSKTASYFSLDCILREV